MPAFKAKPDAIDRRIFRMLDMGCRMQQIGDALEITCSSVETRVMRLKAQRWATSAGKLLTPEQREHLLWLERDAFVLSGKSA